MDPGLPVEPARHVGRELEAVAERGGATGVAVAMTDVYAPVRLAARPAARGLFRVGVESLAGGVLTGSPRG